MPNKLDKLVRFALLAPFVAAMVIHGSTKPPPGPRTGRITFDTRYITDTGSYLTNDTVHIALAKTSAIIPDSTPVLVHAREVGSTNAEDWVELSPRLTIAGFPHDYTLAGATNYDVDVMADYVPPAPVVTNDVLVVNALAAKDSTPPGATLAAVLPQVALVVPIEYLESTGTQWIDTGYRMTSNDMRFECDLMRTTNGGTANFFYGYRFVQTAEYRGNMRAFFVYGAAPIGRIAIRYGANTDNSTATIPINTRVRVAFDGSKVSVDDLEYATLSGASTSPDYGNMYIFDCNTGSYYRGDITRFVGRIYSFAIWQDGALILDLQPVRVGSTGAMLDLVSGRLFFNAGTGSFRLGPDLK